jgi:signal peptidase II
MSMRRFNLSHFLVALAVFVADQISKGMIDRTPQYGFDLPVIPGLFSIVHVENPGVAFGLFQNSSPLWRSGLIVASSLALIAVLGLLWRSQPSVRAGYAMALIVGGACGNLFDRVIHGRVVDFLKFYHGEHIWPVFNLADSAIVIGAGLLVLEIVRDRNPGQESTASLPPPSAPADVPAPPN